MRRAGLSRLAPLSGAVLLLLLAACGSGAAPAPSVSGPANPSPASPAATSAAATAKPAAASAASSAASLDSLLAAAKQEGKVTIVGAPGDVFRQVYDTFSKKYGIPYEILAGNGNADQVPKIDAERKAGQYLWDVVVHSPASQFGGYKPMGALDPLRPALLPEVLDDSKWINGFESGWNDSGKQLSYSFTAYLVRSVYVNRQFMPESTMSKFDDLWDPKVKGKIAMFDPRPPSVGTLVASGILVAKGEDKLRSFLQDQQPVLTQDRRQLAEWLVRGQYPIALGEDQTALKDLANGGVDVSQVKPLLDDDPASAMYSVATGAVGIFNRAPHPNAARLLINWLLSQEGQTVYSQKTTVNSRRTDVPPQLPPELTLDPKKSYLNTQIEDNFSYFTKTSAVAKEVIK